VTSCEVQREEALAILAQLHPFAVVVMQNLHMVNDNSSGVAQNSDQHTQLVEA